MILKKRHKDLLLQLAEKHLSSNICLILYGSRADGTAHDASDLDLALQHVSGESVDIDQLLAFKEAVHDSTIPFLVEIFDYARLPESFHEVIDDQGILLSGKMDQRKVL